MCVGCSSSSLGMCGRGMICEVHQSCSSNFSCLLRLPPAQCCPSPNSNSSSCPIPIRIYLPRREPKATARKTILDSPHSTTMLPRLTKQKPHLLQRLRERIFGRHISFLLPFLSCIAVVESQLAIRNSQFAFVATTEVQSCFVKLAA